MTILELDKVEKHFGGLAAVGGVSMKVNDGEILAIVGPNGAGKSTLLKLIVGLETPTRGKITFEEEDITALAPHRVRRLGIAMVSQTPRPFSTMTVIENAALGALFGKPGAHQREDEALKVAVKALDAVGLADKRNEPVSNLNLHEKRLVGLARGVAGDPKILVLDEVMASLNDTELEESIEIVRKLRDEFNLTVIWVEHVMKAVMSLAERTIVLNFGTVLTRGLPQEVMRHPAVVEAYLGEEMKHA